MCRRAVELFLLGGRLDGREWKKHVQVTNLGLFRQLRWEITNRAGGI